jgi:hypothetical protein
VPAMSDSRKKEVNRQRHVRRTKQRQNKAIVVAKSLVFASTLLYSLKDCILGKYFTTELLDINSVCSLILCCRDFRKRFVQILLATKRIDMKRAEKYKNENEYVKNVIMVTNVSFLESFRHIKTIQFSFYFNISLDAGILPPTLIELDLGYDFNQPLILGTFPSSLKTLHFSDKFDQPLDPNVLPFGLNELKFGKRFNQLLSTGILPSSLTELVFSECFNQPLFVGVLPSNLKKLVFGVYFNQPLFVGVLPSNLKELVFGTCFNQSLFVGVLPPGLFALQVGDEFGQLLNIDVLPSGLRNLRFGSFSYDKDTQCIVKILSKEINISSNMYFSFPTGPKGLSIINNCLEPPVVILKGFVILLDYESPNC